jgi:hypothetical protein
MTSHDRTWVGPSQAGGRCTFHKFGRTFWLDRSGKYSHGSFFQVTASDGLMM